MSIVRVNIVVFAILLAFSATASEELRLKSDTGGKVLPIKDDKIVCEQPVDFKDRTSELLTASRAVLASVAATLETYLDIAQLEIGVHTDSRGSSAYNKRMTQDRADSVRLNLIKMGVKAERLKAVGYGEDRPIESNRTEQGRRHNRRVEFVIKARTQKKDSK